jgi:hypothetical protein
MDVQQEEGNNDNGEQELAALEQELRELLSLVDRAQREALCGPQMLLHYSALRRLVQEYVGLQRENQAALEHFVAESLRLFSHCEQVYATMYATVCQAVERSKQRKGNVSDTTTTIPISVITTNNHNGEGKTAKGGKSSVALDPQSALNIVECEPPHEKTMALGNESSLKIKLHNDNEALLKYPPSLLYQVPNIEQVVQSLEKYYEKECELIHVGYAGKLVEIHQQPLLECTVTRQLLDQITVIEDAWLSVEPVLGERLPDLINEIKERTAGLCRHPPLVNGIKQQQRSQCKTFEANVHAKFLCCVQLKDNMLRSYNLTRLQQRTGVVAAVF